MYVFVKIVKSICQNCFVSKKCIYIFSQFVAEQWCDQKSQIVFWRPSSWPNDDEDDENDDDDDDKKASHLSMMVTTMMLEG